MKIVFDAFWWRSGPPSLRHVLREIIIAWHKQYPGDQLILVGRRKDASLSRDDPGLPGTFCGTRLWPQALSATWAVRRVARRYNADAVLTHNYAARAPRAVSSVYLHDVLFTTNPEWFTRLERAYFTFMCRWISRADIVFTSSHSEAVRIRNNSDAGFVVPVGLGLSTELTSVAEEDPDPALTPSQFLLTVGRLNVRKNLETTILSALHTGRVNQRCPLVVVGSADGKSAQLGSEVQEAIDSGAVRFTGFVSEARLRWLYRNTALFSFLSLGEGFGMPPVEAAYFGAPVLVSDLDVFQETLGSAASYVEPTDTSAISALMAATMTSGWRQQVDARTELGRRHNWDTAVRAMRSAIAETVDNRNGASS